MIKLCIIKICQYYTAFLRDWEAREIVTSVTRDEVRGEDIHLHTHTHPHTHTHTHTHTNTHTHKHIYIFIYIYIYVCVGWEREERDLG